TWATGSLVGPPWKISARTCVSLSRNAGRTGTLQRPNLKRRGNKAKRNCFIRTAKHTRRLSVNQIRTSPTGELRVCLLSQPKQKQRSSNHGHETRSLSHTCFRRRSDQSILRE